MKTINKLSNVELIELSRLLSDLDSQVHQYSHVSNYLSASIMMAIKEQTGRVNNEINKRDI